VPENGCLPIKSFSKLGFIEFKDFVFVDLFIPRPLVNYWVIRIHKLKLQITKNNGLAQKRKKHGIEC